jgi:hypothetical protein
MIESLSPNSREDMSDGPRPMCQSEATGLRGWIGTRVSEVNENTKDAANLTIFGDYGSGSNPMDDFLDK